MIKKMLRRLKIVVFVRDMFYFSVPICIWQCIKQQKIYCIQLLILLENLYHVLILYFSKEKKLYLYTQFFASAIAFNLRV